MHITPSSLARLLEFMEITATQTYPELPTDLHDMVTERAMAVLFDKFVLPLNARILDVGCGQGVALIPFRERGYDPVGITLNETDAIVCQKLGFSVQVMDQSFLEFENSSYDLIWARHVLEHSIMPLYTLTEFNRVLRAGGIMYLEVPASDTIGHEDNPNHYSVLGKAMWNSLVHRSGFDVVGTTNNSFQIVDGRTDEYWGYYCRKRDLALLTPGR